MLMLIIVVILLNTIIFTINWNLPPFPANPDTARLLHNKMSDDKVSSNSDTRATTTTNNNNNHNNNNDSDNHNNNNNDNNSHSLRIRTPAQKPLHYPFVQL